MEKQQYNEFKVFERTGERFLDIVNNTEDKFIYTLEQIKWSLRSSKYLSDIITQYYNGDFSKLNAYAVVLGDMCLDDSNEINNELYKKSVSLLKLKSDFRTIVLDELIDKTDILRYAVLMKRLKTKASSEGVNSSNYNEEQNDDEYDKGDYADEYDDEYDENQFTEGDERNEMDEQTGDY